VAEEQPQKDDHRNRHTHQPKQKSFTHRSLLDFSIVKTTRFNMRGSRTELSSGEGTIHDVGISESDKPIRNSE
jgi:hypothetical protein